MYRQGDILIFAASPSAITLRHEEVSVDPGGGLVLAYGEATGHAHRVLGAGAHLYRRGAASDMVLALSTGARLVHEEHGEIDLPSGIYVVRRQREYAPGEVRIVAD
jgi:hypothetical protein